MDRNQKCTLTDQELIEKCDQWITDLAHSGGRKWSLRVPVDFNHDPDMLFTELIERYKATLLPPPVEGESEIEKIIAEFESFPQELKDLYGELFMATRPFAQDKVHDLGENRIFGYTSFDYPNALMAMCRLYAQSLSTKDTEIQRATDQYQVENNRAHMLQERVDIQKERIEKQTAELSRLKEENERSKNDYSICSTQHGMLQLELMRLKEENEKWSKLSAIAPPHKWLEMYAEYQDILIQQDAGNWHVEQFNIANTERNQLKEENEKLKKERDILETDNYHLKENLALADEEYQSLRSQLTAPGHWVSVETAMPDESGRYWCYVRSLGDLGWSYYQWNCSYDDVTNRFAGQSAGDNVTHWTNLLPHPTPQPAKEDGQTNG